MYQPVDKGPTGAAPMADLPNLSVELSQFEESAKLSDVNVDTSSKTDVDEEAQKRVVEPQLVIAGDNSRESSPTKRFFGGSFKGPSRLSSTVLNINDLPHDVAENLRAYDINGDGLISMTELVHGAMTQHEQEEKVPTFYHITVWSS